MVLKSLSSAKQGVDIRRKNISERLFSKDIFHNPPYSILSRECYTDFVFFKLDLRGFVFIKESSKPSRFKESRAVFIVIFLSSSSLRLIY